MPPTERARGSPPTPRGPSRARASALRATEEAGVPGRGGQRKLRALNTSMPWQSGTLLRVSIPVSMKFSIDHRRNSATALKNQAPCGTTTSKPGRTTEHRAFQRGLRLVVARSVDIAPDHHTRAKQSPIGMRGAKKLRRQKNQSPPVQHAQRGWATLRARAGARARGLHHRAVVAAREVDMMRASASSTPQILAIEGPSSTVQPPLSGRRKGSWSADVSAAQPTA